jgi:hypothetical protein
VIDWDDIFTRPRQPLTLKDEIEPPTTFRVRIEIVGVVPPIWRTLDVMSDVSLDELHGVIQAVFGWEDRHLHRFHPTPDPYTSDLEMIINVGDEDEGEEGIPEWTLTLDRLLHEPGDSWYYTYDFGDNWTHLITLESTHHPAADSPRAFASRVNGEGQLKTQAERTAIKKSWTSSAILRTRDITRCRSG